MLYIFFKASLLYFCPSCSLFCVRKSISLSMSLCPQSRLFPSPWLYHSRFLVTHISLSFIFLSYSSFHSSLSLLLSVRFFLVLYSLPLFLFLIFNFFYLFVSLFFIPFRHFLWLYSFSLSLLSSSFLSLF